ncbi:MAG: flagellar export chaperone FlgN [Desulfobacterales bacterium]
MDKETIQYVEEIFYKKILHYNDLRAVFQREKTALIDLDMDVLWDVSREKEELCATIEGIRQKLFSIFSEPGIGDVSSLMQVLDLLPIENRAQFQPLYHSISRLKGEIDAMRKENMSHVDSSLEFLDEIITVIAGGDQNQSTYDNRSRLRKPANAALLSREV